MTLRMYPASLACIQVEEFFQSGIEAFNAHDLDRFLDQFADDVRMYTPSGWLEGNPAVRARAVSPDAEVKEFRWRVFPRGSGPAFHGVGSGVYVRRGDRWVEVLEHETVVQVDEELRPPAGAT